MGSALVTTPNLNLDEIQLNALVFNLIKFTNSQITLKVLKQMIAQFKSSPDILYFLENT